jgi:DNA-binding NarL/FixJ family response regulator
MKQRTLVDRGSRDGPAFISECEHTDARRRDNNKASEMSTAPRGSDVMIVVLVTGNAHETCTCGADVTANSNVRGITINDGALAQTIFKAIGAGGPSAIAAPSGELLARVASALAPRNVAAQKVRECDDASIHFANLTSRQQEIMELVLAGHANKIIAADLRISQRTVENHRACIMKKTGAKSLAALVRLAMIAGRTGAGAPTSSH